jgi:hypothetical protein
MTFYAYNIAIKGPSQAEIASCFEAQGEIGVVTPQENGVAIFSSGNCLMKDRIEQYARLMSQQFDCPVLAMHNYDDSVLWYQLIADGEILDEYDSCPSYLDFSGREKLPNASQGGNAPLLCKTWGVNSDWVPLLDGILRESKGADREIPDFETEIRNLLQGVAEPTPTSHHEASHFALAFQTLPATMQEEFTPKFIDACIKAGVGDQAPLTALRFGFQTERERHAALAAALGLPFLVTSLCALEEDELAPEGTIFLGLEE